MGRFLAPRGGHVADEEALGADEDLVANAETDQQSDRLG